VEAPPGFEECEQEEWLYNPSTKAWMAMDGHHGARTSEIFWKFWGKKGREDCRATEVRVSV